MSVLVEWLTRGAIEWLTKDGPPPPSPLCDFKRLQFELRPGDVILVEGRTRVADVIKVITQSAWSHSALYVGRIYDIVDTDLRAEVELHYQGDPQERLVIEAVMGKGTIVSPLTDYRHDHLRICRPDSLAPDDAQKVISYAIDHLGWGYDIRQILDLARFFFPWSFLPRRWRSSLFQHNAGSATRIVCSTLLAEAFGNVDYPILPFIDRGEDGSVRFFKRNPRLFSPSDFDYSPYFSIIKYPFLGLNDLGLYRKLPWSQDDVVYNDELHDFHPSCPVSETPPKTAAVEIEKSPDQVAANDDVEKTKDSIPKSLLKKASAFSFRKPKE